MLMDGKLIAKDIKSQIASEIREMKASIGKSPGLAVVLVGKRRDSHTFIRIKLKACDEVGIATFTMELPEDCTEDEVLNVVSNFNRNPLVHGIIVQLPLPQVISPAANSFFAFCTFSSCYACQFKGETKKPISWTSENLFKFFTLSYFLHAIYVTWKPKILIFLVLQNGIAMILYLLTRYMYGICA